ncbi:UDP-N-acetylglucosamine 1-carboxyvinyltransferase [Apilactobacillus apinorum]|uniref:UDP-N-acetylglucosamine 1-carboxyvinyltransferase n=1 Tax=Apilactobacillus apinorum TaxID=1218495 RepID=UPI0006B496EE|nr:UDP-N-acetylglucosamine 1-carboxyvinyltransferase [Apilactobacillus apinorum]KOY69568.1 UDP-N-acetylglucosamine 1-carboxyvinyltransferase [Apilactobacillus apinorum]CAI2631071.1 murA UDP-N-acetylglucosamine 1-carboxyvinyltransferase [Apilactobacillus apinorum]
MNKMIIKGGHRLSGSVTIGGAKNSTVALIPAAILADTKVQFDMVPNILDVHNLMVILESMNVSSDFADGILNVDPTKIVESALPSKAIKSLRASYYFMGALLGRFGRARITFPGGDNIGPRPIDQHIKAFQAMGAKVVNDGDEIIITTDENGLHGAQIFLDVVSVGATINAILAAVKADGHTVIRNAAKEPEIIDVVTFLNNMGAKVRGAGTDVIRIEGVESLRAKNTHIIIPDRIEAGTYLSMAAAYGDGVTIKNVIPEHLESFIAKVQEMGIDLEINEDSIYVPKTDELKNIEIKTMPYPGFATDLQQPITPLLLMAKGDSTIIDTIYPERTKHIEELKKMGAKIKYDHGNGTIIVSHTDKLVGSQIEAGEIRAGASEMIAGLMAEGTTVIDNADNILRGYDNIIDKLTNLNADVEMVHSES